MSPRTPLLSRKEGAQVLLGDADGVRNPKVWQVTAGDQLVDRGRRDLQKPGHLANGEQAGGHGGDKNPANGCIRLHGVPTFRGVLLKGLQRLAARRSARFPHHHLTGRRRGTEVVQLYAADTATGVTLPAQQLIGFARVDLEPGASKSVAFVVPMSLLAYTGLSGQLVMEPGPVGLGVGASSSDIRSSATLTVTGKTRSIRGKDRAFLSTATVGQSQSHQGIRDKAGGPTGNGGPGRWPYRSIPFQDPYKRPSSVTSSVETSSHGFPSGYTPSCVTYWYATESLLPVTWLWGRDDASPYVSVAKLFAL